VLVRAQEKPCGIAVPGEAREHVPGRRVVLEGFVPGAWHLVIDCSRVICGLCALRARQLLDALTQR